MPLFIVLRCRHVGCDIYVVVVDAVSVCVIVCLLLFMCSLSPLPTLHFVFGSSLFALVLLLYCCVYVVCISVYVRHVSVLSPVRSCFSFQDVGSLKCLGGMFCALFVRYYYCFCLTFVWRLLLCWALYC